MEQDYLQTQVDMNDPDLAQVFDETSLWGGYFGRLLFENVPLRSHLKVLDVGCGNGFPLFELAHQLGPTCQLTGMDIWEPALQRAAFKKKFYKLENVEIVKADASKMPFGDEYFDLIVSNLGINNFQDPRQVLNECYRVLKPNAEMLITTNTVGHMKLFYSVYREVLKTTGRSALLPQLERQEAHRKTADEIITMFQIAGFHIVNTIDDNLRLRYLDGTSFLRHSLTVYGFLGGWRSILKEEEEKLIFGKIEEKLNEIAEINGDIRFNVPMLLVHARKA